MPWGGWDQGPLRAQKQGTVPGTEESFRASNCSVERGFICTTVVNTCSHELGLKHHITFWAAGQYIKVSKSMSVSQTYFCLQVYSRPLPFGCACSNNGCRPGSPGASLLKRGVLNQGQWASLWEPIRLPHKPSLLCVS